jgi:hypothetical protein
MRFEIISDDSVFNKGVVKNILISIDGKQMTVPIKMKLGELYTMFKSSSVKPTSLTMPTSEIVAPAPIVEEKIIEGVIEKMDCVRCVNVVPRMRDQSGNELMEPGLTVGTVYKVLNIKKLFYEEKGEQKSIDEYYEVEDVNAPVPRRITAFPNEVALVEKHKPREPKIMPMSEIRLCGFCQTENALLLDRAKNMYVGNCYKCGKLIEVERPKVAA